MSVSTGSSSALLGFLLAVQAAIAGPQAPELVFYPDDPLVRDHDDRTIAPPEATESDLLIIGVAQDAPADGEASYAVNINTLGEIPDSSWFTNRYGHTEMSHDELRRGPDRVGPPADGEWRVVGQPSAGRTPKFTIEDAAGRRYIIKLDSPEYPELASSAEIIGTKFFHAFGYHVPENYLVFFDPERVVLEDQQGRRADYRLAMLDEAARDDEGRVRAVASLFLDGQPMGPFSYAGTRPDDPNDIFPHQHRRELRGLAVFASWLNHTDTKAGNSLDVLVEEEGRRFVRHHLIDFGSILGAAAIGVKDPATGYERYIEPEAIFKSAATLGIWTRPYARVEFPPYPAIGHLEADYYQPKLWRPPVVNPAFELMDAADAFWAARIVSRFDDAAIRAIVATARLSDPEAEEVLVNLLRIRRDKVLHYWLTRTNPLDDFRVESAGSRARLRFENAAVHKELAGPVHYRHTWYRLDNETGERRAVTDPTANTTAELTIPTDAWGPADPHALRYAEVRIETIAAGYPHWQEPVVVTLRRSPAPSDGIEVVGVRRPREIPAP